MNLHYDVPGDDYALAGAASAEVKKNLKLLGIPPELIRKAIIAMYEAEINMIIHAGGGKADVTITPESVRIAMKDEGPGIADIDLAMREGYSTASDEARGMGFGSGMGFSNMKRNSDSLSVISLPGEGTLVEIRIDLKEGSP